MRTLMLSALQNSALADEPQAKASEKLFHMKLVFPELFQSRMALAKFWLFPVEVNPKIMFHSPFDCFANTRMNSPESSAAAWRVMFTVTFIALVVLMLLLRFMAQPPEEMVHPAPRAVVALPSPSTPPLDMFHTAVGAALDTLEVVQLPVRLRLVMGLNLSRNTSGPNSMRASWM